MPLALESLPDEILGVIINQLSFHSLCNISTLSKRWHELAKSELFSEIDLSRRNAEETQELYDALFVAQPGKRALLDGANVKSLSFSFVEDFLDKKELAAKQAISVKLMQSLRSISVLNLEISLVNEKTVVFEKTLLPAIVSFSHNIKDKVGSIELTVDAFDGMDAPLEDEDDETEVDSDLALKLAAISAAMPTNLLSVLHLVGVTMSTLPPPFANLFTSSALSELFLQDCGGALNSLPTISNLTKLAVSWTQSDSCALSDALDMSKRSSTTLKALQLQKVLPEGELWHQTWSESLALPHLTQLQIGDDHFGAGSLLDLILKHADLPKLAVLTLETGDILDPKSNFAERLGNFGDLRKIVFIEGAQRRGPPQAVAATPFQELSRACIAKGVQMECRVSPVCDTPVALAVALGRLKVFSDSLVKLSLNLQGTALFEVATLPTLILPNTSQILVGVSGIRTVGQEHEAVRPGASKSTIGDLLKHVQAPNLTALHISIFMTDDSAFSNFDSVKQTLLDDFYPNLERVVGTMMAGPGMSKNYLEEYAEEFKQLCASKGIEGASVEFISNEDLFDNFIGDGDEDDESIASDDVDGSEFEEDESIASSPGDGFARSESGESGYGEDASLLQPRQGPAKEIDDSDESDSDYVPDDHSNTSSDSDDSWMTDE